MAPVGQNPCREYSRCAAPLPMVTQSRTSGYPARLAQPSTAETSTSPAPRPRQSGFTHIETSSAVPSGSIRQPAVPTGCPSCRTTNWARPASRSRQSSSDNRTESASVEPNSRGAPANAVSLIRRNSRQSRGLSCCASTATHRRARPGRISTVLPSQPDYVAAGLPPQPAQRRRGHRLAIVIGDRPEPALPPVHGSRLDLLGRPRDKVPSRARAGCPARRRSRHRRQLLVTAGDNPGRLRSERSFARLCGVAPVPVSSGRTDRHRLHRGGDRDASSALWRIALVRMHCHQPTKDYVARRTAEGRTKKEILRCLKRYIAREIYPRLLSPTSLGGRQR